MSLTRLPTSEVEAAAFAGHRPFIITGEVDRWPAMRKWTPHYLSKKISATTVEVAESDSGIFRYSDVEPDRQYTMTTISPAGFLATDWLGEPAWPPRYLMAQSIPDLFPDLAGDIIIPRWIRSDPHKEALWIGPAGTTTPLHFDLDNNLFAQITGSKRFTIFPPTSTDGLRAHPRGSATSHLSYLDLEDEATADLVSDSGAQFELRAGEMVYLPAYWWHHVHALERSISVNFWWAADLAQHLEPNGLRQLWTAYRADRLQSVKSTVLDPLGIGWSAAADLVATRSVEAAAVIMSAALHEFLRSLIDLPTYLGDGDEQSSMRRLAELVEEIAPVPADSISRLTALADDVDRLCLGDAGEGNVDPGSLLADLSALVAELRSVN